MPVTANSLGGDSGFSTIRVDAPVAVELRHAEMAKVLDVALAREHDARAALLPREVLDGRA